MSLEQKLEHQIRYLERRISILQVISDRVSWLRVIVFVAGLLVAYAGLIIINAMAGVGILAIVLIAFAVVVFYHRRLERWIDTLTVWRELKADQLARLNLDWENLPGPVPLIKQVNQSLTLDLDLTGPRSLHQLLDTTNSRQGSQLIADWLTNTHQPLEQVHARQNLVRELTPLARFRTRFRLTCRLGVCEQLEPKNLLAWLAVEFPAARLRWALPVATLLVIINLVLFVLNQLDKLPPFWIISLLAYVIFYLTNQKALGAVFEALLGLDAQLDKFSAILKYLETAPQTSRGHLGTMCAPLRDPRHAPSAQLRRIKIATTAVGLRSNPVLTLVLNLISPWDFLCAWLAKRYRDQTVELLPVWVKIVNELDALIALGNLSALHPEYTFPVITPEAQPVFEAEALGHPLIPTKQQVHNDLTVTSLGQIAIITGSNMAGKSTFLKTVGINLCLAYAGAPVNAARFVALPFRLHTCIHITDSIVDGFSYFYAEVKCLKSLLDELQAAEERPLLYLIDEIFRGTNNRERLLGSRAYVRAVLGANGIGLLATHDLELASLADQRPQVHNYHFRDQVSDGRLIFDYKIRPGPSPTTNALKIMQLEGLPVETEE